MKIRIRETEWYIEFCFAHKSSTRNYEPMKNGIERKECSKEKENK